MITLRNVQLFFQRIGYQWKGEFLGKDKKTFVKAKSFEDIKTTNVDLTILRLYKGKRKGDVAFYVAESQLKHYKVKSQPKVGKLYDLENDLSKKWRDFLKEKESTTSFDLEALSKREWKDFIDAIDFYIPKNFNRKGFSVKVNATTPQKATISMHEIEGSATMCIEVGDNLFSIYIKKDGKIHKISSDYIEQEWEKFKILTSDKLFAIMETDK